MRFRACRLVTRGGRGSRSRLPRTRTLAADAWAGRARGLTRLARSVRTLRQGLAELGGARPPRRLPPTSLNRPTGPQRRLDVVAGDLAAIRDLGHAHGGTVNDVILAAIAGAIRALLASRGEELDLVTASVPVSARQAAAGGQLGNQVGTMPVALPAGGDLAARVTRIAAITRERKTAARGTSARCLDRRSGCWPPPGCSAGSSTASGWFIPSSPTCAARPSRSHSPAPRYER